MFPKACNRGASRLGKEASPSLEAPRLQALENTGPLSSTEQKGKDCHDQDKQVQGASFGFVFGT